ncbi:unnamed protein product, partial [Iphiclides podalirius]
MNLLCILLTLFATFKSIASVSSLRATRLPRLIGGNEYIIELMQNAVYEMEEYGWWNFKLFDVSQVLDERMYNWHVSGTVNYTNGFVVSIEKIDLQNLFHSVTTRTVNDTVEWSAMVRSNLNLRDVRVGFDVTVNLDGKPEQKYTGVFTHSLITIQCLVFKNLNSNQYEVSSQVLSLSAGSGVRMIYLPENHVTQVVSRRYVPSNNWNSIRNWCNEIISPILLKSAEKIDFPRVCFGC